MCDSLLLNKNEKCGLAPYSMISNIGGYRAEVDWKFTHIVRYAMIFIVGFGVLTTLIAHSNFNEKEVNNLKQTKVFKTATTTRMGNIFNKHINHLHTLPRIQVLGTQQDLSILDLYLCGAIPAIKNRFKRRMKRGRC